MKWNDLTLKERKRIYDSIKAENPNITYLELKEQFDNIPAYEDGKQSKWLNNREYRDSIISVQDKRAEQQHALFKKLQEETGSAEDLSPKYYNDKTDSNSSIPLNESGLFSDISGALQSFVNDRNLDKKLSESGNVIIQAAENTNKEKYEKTKQGLVAAGVLAQAGLAFAGSAAGAMGHSTIAELIGAGQSLWNGKELVDAIVDEDNLGIWQNAVPIGLNALGVSKYIPRLNQVNGINAVSKISNTSGLVWDWLPNPIIEAFKIKRDRETGEVNNVPAYKYGKESETPSPVDYTFGTKEYFDRQQKISGNIDMVQPEAYLTPAGYLKSAIGLAEDISNGNYEDAAFDIALNSIPYGVGKILKKSNPFKYKYLANSLKSKKKLESDYDSEFSEVIRRDRNMKKYDKEISQTIYDAVFPDETTKELIDNVDKIYGTNYKDAYKRIAMRDMTNRGKYLRYKDLGNKNGSVRSKNIVDDIEPTIDNFEVTLDPNQYLPGTGNHELGHLSDFLAKRPDTNGYLYYLLDEDNVMGPSELKRLGISINPSTQSYLLNPTEAKSHMLHLKRAMIENGNIPDWSSNIDKKTLEDFLFDPKNSSVVNNMNKNQYLMYRDKNRFIERLNKLIPMELAAPIAINSNKGEE